MLVSGLAALLLVASCTSSGHQPRRDGHPSASQGSTATLVAARPGAWAGRLPAGWTVQAWHVPQPWVDSLSVSSDGASVAWGDLSEDALFSTSLADLDTTTRQVRRWEPDPGQSIVSFVRFDGGYAVMTTEAGGTGCASPPCQTLVVETLTDLDDTSPRILARATWGSTDYVALTTVPDGLVWEMPHGKGPVVSLLAPGDDAPRMIRRGTRQDVGITGIPGGVIGQVIYDRSVWVAPTGARPVSFPGGRTHAGVPVGSSYGLLWRQQERGGDPVRVSMRRADGSFGPVRRIPGTGWSYNTLWLDACHLVQRHPRRFSTIELCAAGFPRVDVLGPREVEQMSNPGRFDSAAGRFVWAMTAGSGVDITLVDTHSG